MKIKLLFLLLFTSLRYTLSFSQACDLNTGSVFYLQTQDELDDFAAQFPNCTTIEVDVRIEGDDITDLSSFSNITRIDGYLHITNCNNLQNLSGLENLAHIGEWLSLSDNDLLADITALGNLEYLGDYLGLFELKALTTANFASLDSVFTEVWVKFMPNLPENTFSQLVYANEIKVVTNSFSELTGFQNLQTVGELIDIEFNAALMLIDGFDKLKNVNGKIDINDNAVLSEIRGFSEMEEIATDLRVNDNPLLQTIQGFDNLEVIGNSFLFDECPLLSDMSQSFGSLDSIHNLFSIRGTSITSFSNFQSLRTTGTVLITDNSMLENLSGLEAFERIHGELHIYRNAKLQDISSINQLDHSTMYLKDGISPVIGVFQDHILVVAENPLLQTCDINIVCDLLKRLPPSLIYITDNGAECSDVEDVLIAQCRSHTCFSEDLRISSTEEIDSLFDQLPVCNFIDGDLILGENAALAENGILDLSEMDFIDTIIGDIIVENTLLKEIIGLDKLKYLGGIFSVKNNPNLEKIDIVNIANNIGEIIIENNPKLTEEITFRPSGMVGNIVVKNNPLLTQINLLNKISLKGNIVLEDNPQMQVGLGFDHSFVLDGNVKVQNAKFMSTMRFGIVTGSIELDRLEDLTTNAIIFGDSIMGDLIFQNIPEVDLIKILRLKYIGGNFEILNNPKLETFEKQSSLSDPELRYIGGDLRIINNNLDDSGLEKAFEFLRTIEGELDISQNPRLEALSAFNSLQYNTTSSISITNNEILNDCDLKTLCWQMANNPASVQIAGNLGNCLDFQAAELSCDLDTCVSGLSTGFQEEVDRWLEINELCSVIPDVLGISDQTPDMEQIDLTGLSNIEVVMGNVGFGSSKLKNLSGLDNLRIIHGDLTFANNSSEFDKSSLGNLEHVGGELEVNTVRFESFEGLNNLRSLGSLRITLEDSFRSFEGLNALQRIEDGIVLRFLEMNSFKGLDNLEYVGGQIEVNNVKGLRDISSIGYLPAEPLDFIKINGNDSLKFCNYPLFCEFKKLNPTSPIYILLGNGEGCFDDDLECQFYGIRGRAYFDINENGLKDIGEYGIPGIPLVYDDGELLSNENGKYQLVLNDGDSYNISVEDDDWTTTTSPDSYSGVIDTNTYLDQKDFGLIPNFSKHEVQSNISMNYNRCSERGFYYLNIQNTGTFIENGEIRFIYDKETEYVNSTVAPDFIDEENGLIIWKYSDLNPFQNIYIRLIVIQPDFNYTGESISSTLEVYHNLNTELELLDDYNYEFILRCSYDPNDKQVNPLGAYDEAFLLRDELLTYTIRFQNTGNDYARNVRLVDTLPEAVDLNSFRVVNASHEVFTTIVDREVTFDFFDIYLIDSLTDPELSQGFVSFSLALDEETPDFTVIENDADIYFDFNPPIRTNIVTNTIVEMLPTSVEEQSVNDWIKIHPNPAGDYFNFSSALNGKVRLYDSSFRLRQEAMVTADQELTFYLSNDSSGMYFVSFISDEGITVTKSIMKY